MKRTEELGIDNLKLIQDTDLFCFGTDSVLLSDFARVPSGGKVLDLCTGNGIIPVLLCAKTKAKSIVGIEILKESYDIACENVKINKLEDRLAFINGDLKNWKEHFKAGWFDAVTCNPPYMKVDSGKRNLSTAKYIARHEVCGDINGFCKAGFKLLKHGGRFYVVWRPDRICDLFYALRSSRLEPKIITFVHADARTEPSIVLVSATKGGASGATVTAPLILYEDTAHTAMSERAKRIYETLSFE